MLQGSVGKTYVSAIALQLIKERKINLDEKVSTYLGGFEWYSKIPNAAEYYRKDAHESYKWCNALRVQRKIYP